MHFFKQWILFTFIDLVLHSCNTIIFLMEKNCNFIMNDVMMLKISMNYNITQNITYFLQC